MPEERLTAEEIKEARKRRKRAEAILESRHLPNQPEIVCGCCFVDYPSTQITQCADGHLFCLECAKRSAQNVIGLRKTQLKCISTDSCRFDFSITEIARFLPEKEFKAYETMLQEKEISKAKLEGFVQCPFCPFGIIGNPEGTIFECLNTDICGVESCLKCKKKAHGKKPCEAESSATNQIAEAMTEALMRECPGCHTKFFKIEGCNKMTCTCGVKICYACRKRIKGYEHFQQAGGCQLHDDTNARNKNDAVKAGEAKMAELGLHGSTAEKLLDGSTFKVITEPKNTAHFRPGMNDPMNDLRNQVRQAEAQFHHYYGRYTVNQARITSVNHELMNVNHALFQAMERLRQRMRFDLPRMLAIVQATFPQSGPAVAVEQARLRVLLVRYEAFLQQKAEFDGPLKARERERLVAMAAERNARIAAQREERKRKATERINAVKAGFERATVIAEEVRANATSGRRTKNSLGNRTGLVFPAKQAVIPPRVPNRTVIPPRAPNQAATPPRVPRQTVTVIDPRRVKRKQPMTLDDVSPREAIKRLNASRERIVFNGGRIPPVARPNYGMQPLVNIPLVVPLTPLKPGRKLARVEKRAIRPVQTDVPRPVQANADAVIEIPGPSRPLTSRGRDRQRPTNQPGPSRGNDQQVVFISDSPLRTPPHIIDLTSSR